MALRPRKAEDKSYNTLQIFSIAQKPLTRTTFYQEKMSQSLNSTSSQKSTLVELPSSCMTTAEADEAKERQNHKNRATREAKKLGKKLDNTIKELSETELLANKTQEEIVTLLVSSVALKGEDRGQVTRLAHVKLVQNKVTLYFAMLFMSAG